MLRRSLYAMFLLMPFWASMATAGGAPVVTGLLPSSGLVGTNVRVLGTNLSGVASVIFSSSDVVFPADFIIESDTSVVATVPFNTVTGPVSVNGASGTATVPGGFTVIPMVIGTTKLVGVSAGSGGATFSVVGGDHALFFVDLTVSGLAPNGAYLVDAHEGNCDSLGYSTYSFGSLFTDGTGSGAVHGSFPLLSAQIGHLFSPPNVLCLGTPGYCNLCGRIEAVSPPSLTSFTPASGHPGTIVTITGSNLSGVHSVTIDELPAVFRIVSNSTITATVPDGAYSGPIGVQNVRAVVYGASDFVVESQTPVQNTTWGRIKTKYR